MSTHSRLPKKTPKTELNFISIIKNDGQQYLFFFDDRAVTRIALLHTIGQFASDPELNFSWADATLVRMKMNQIADQA